MSFKIRLTLERKGNHAPYFDLLLMIKYEVQLFLRKYNH